ncbi:MAG: hypothetical protein QOD53_1319, partial [Thermoleophilaceae bacterium]|nr:hypothetical protein [Thermoleophilaceae bacterium]
WVAVVVASFAPFVPAGGVRALWDRTLGYQAGRDSPFSLWGQYGSLSGVHVAVEVGAVALALLLAFFPRGRRTTVQVAALTAAVLIALQLAAVHWFYLYVAWFAPLVLVALLAWPRQPSAGAADQDLLDAGGQPVVAGFDQDAVQPGVLV